MSNTRTEPAFFGAEDLPAVNDSAEAAASYSRIISRHKAAASDNDQIE